MNELALFAGAGGGILGGRLLGWRTVCAVEWEPYAASVLAQRQNDGLLSAFPIWDDVQTFDGRPWRGCVDVVSGGFPCQDISVAGKGAGINGARSGMWGHMARIVGEVRPRYVFVENSPALLARGLGRVLGDLAALGYDCRWTVLGAADVGAHHKRERIWIFANANSQSITSLQHCCSQKRSETFTSPWSVDFVEFDFGDGVGRKRIPQPGIPRVAHGVAARVDRLKAIGNGQVPICAATAFKLLTETA